MRPSDPALLIVTGVLAAAAALHPVGALAQPHEPTPGRADSTTHRSPHELVTAVGVAARF